MHSPFSTYLNEKIQPKDFDRSEFIRVIELSQDQVINQWCSGERLPKPSDLPKLAGALRVDAIDLSLIWVASACPELEGKLLMELIRRTARNIPNATADARA
jgi:hypothetical protein